MMSTLATTHPIPGPHTVAGVRPAVGESWLQFPARFIVPWCVFGGIGLKVLGEGRIGQAYLLSALLLTVGPLCLHLMAGGQLAIRSRRVALLAAIFAGTYVVSLLVNLQSSRDIDADFFVPLLKILVSISSFLLACQLDWSDRRLWRGLLLTVLVLLVPAAALCLRKTSPELVVANVHTNVIAAAGFLALGFGWLNRCGSPDEMQPRLSLWSMLTGLAVIVATHGRSLEAAVLVVIACHYLLGKIDPRSPWRHLLFAGVCGLVLMIPLVYSSLDRWSSFDAVDRLSQQLTGKSIFSGRQRLWEAVLQDVEARPWFGYGSHSRQRWEWTLSNGGSVKLSAHNYYLSVLHEAGIFGMAGALALFAAIWAGLSSRLDIPACRLGAALFLGILCYQSFEVCLTSGDYQRGIGLWMLLGCALSRVEERHKSHVVEISA